MEIECAECGVKRYILRPEYYVFKIKRTKKTEPKWFCCYTCKLKYERSHNLTRRRRAG